MKLIEFNGLYKSIAKKVLDENLIINGNNIHLIKDFAHLAVIRQGGVVNLMATVEFVVCYRHTFLRRIDQNDDGPSSNSHDYPFKFLLKDLNKVGVANIKYKPHNLHTPFEKIDVSLLNEKDCEDLLSKIFTQIKDIFPLLSKKLTPEFIKKEVQKEGESAWIEKQWIVDYTDIK